MRSIKRFNDGSCIIAIRSINDKNIPFDEKFVRGTCNYDVYVFPIKDSNDVGIICVSNINPMGWIPAYVINNFKNDSANWLLNMQKLYKN